MQRIMLTGASGIGKTTLARHISRKYDIPFISGSYSDLVPSTKFETHEYMINKGSDLILAQDTQVLNLRHNQVKAVDKYVSDRCYIDSMAYHIQKLSHRVPICQSNDFINLCEELLFQDVDKVIFLPYTYEHIDFWNLEDNDKRVMNIYYQIMISDIIRSIICEKFSYTDPIYLTHPIPKELHELDYSDFVCTIQKGTKTIKILTLFNMNLSNRLSMIYEFIENH